MGKKEVHFVETTGMSHFYIRVTEDGLLFAGQSPTFRVKAELVPLMQALEQGMKEYWRLADIAGRKAETTKPCEPAQPELGLSSKETH